MIWGYKKGNSTEPPQNIREGKGTIDDMGDATCPVCGHICYPGVDEDSNLKASRSGTWYCTKCPYRYTEDESPPAK